jgi:F-type H+-transporting ATPase subunit b
MLHSFPMFAAGLALDATFFALVALILFFGIVLYSGAHKKIGAALDGRATQISKDIADARKLREEAEALLADYKQKRLDAEKEAQDIVARAKLDAAAYAEESKRKLSEMLERRTKQAEYKIAQAQAAAEKEVRSAAADRAIAIATEALAKSVSGTGGDHLISDSIAAVKTRLN